jgi:hypothetical protein
MVETSVHVRHGKKRLRIVAAIIALSSLGFAALINMTFEDFHLSGTQVGDLAQGTLWNSDNCRNCHGDIDDTTDPFGTWSGSLMAQAGRDPLFFAQMTNANQDVGNIGYFCLRCHVPMSFVTEHAYQPDGSTLDSLDKDGITCHFCHSMVDPIYKPGISPIEDQAILAAMPEVPQHYGNSMFVLDPNGVRRGPLQISQPFHETIYSPFHLSGDMCGTCHDVGNVATTKQPDGTYQYNTIDLRTPSEDPHTQFPLERTYTEWKLSAFANGGVEMGGLFNGTGPTLIQNCQDCHMPKTTGQACVLGPTRPDLPKHEFAGASAQVMDIIAAYTAGDPAVEPAALARGRAASVSMLERAAALEIQQVAGTLKVRVVNQSGHKLPTGHIEGRRVWINAKFFDAGDALVREYGHYDSSEAELDEPSTRIYEMRVGLSAAAAALTGYPAGETGHMSLADTIVKDNRIPPRGFQIATYAAGGAPVVGAPYADGQHWDDAHFTIPVGTVRAEVAVYYQCTPRHYIDMLRDGNVTDNWGQTLHTLWTQTGKGAPILMEEGEATLTGFVYGDVDQNGSVHFSNWTLDLQALQAVWGLDWSQVGFNPHADLDGDHHIGAGDLKLLMQLYPAVRPTRR